jgi:hypothetical protein
MKPNFSHPWGFTRDDSLRTTPRWWRKRRELLPHFLELLDAGGWKQTAEHELWGHGVSSACIAEFFCLVARYGKEQVIGHYFSAEAT